MCKDGGDNKVITDLFYRLTQLFLLLFYPISGLGHYNPLYNDMFRPLYLAIIRFVRELKIKIAVLDSRISLLLDLLAQWDGKHKIYRQ